ncbi:MAG: cytochrome c [Helicobacter sp.]|nr:cytochrome c [Helicobacter sp.]
MRILAFLLLFGLLFGDDDFLTIEEYGKELYANPRGISCKACHGDTGEGKIISTYTDKNGKTRILQTKSIKDLDFRAFKARLKRQKSSGFMPIYYLRDSEIAAIYHFINKSKDKQEGATK